MTAASQDSTKGRQALEHLCAIYWYPLHAFVRREGHAAHDAQDLTQEFFARLLQDDRAIREQDRRKHFDARQFWIRLFHACFWRGSIMPARLSSFKSHQSL